MLRTCTGWCAAIQAVPALWPVAVLHSSNVNWMSWAEGEGIPYQGAVQTARDMAWDAQNLLHRAATLDPPVWSVRLEGHGFTQQARASRPH